MMVTQHELEHGVAARLADGEKQGEAARIYFSDRDPAGPYRVIACAGRE
ncbi:hypothetical protein [Sorangium sp. So ce233]